MTTPPQSGLLTTQPGPPLVSVHEHTTFSHDVSKEARLAQRILETDDVAGAPDDRRELRTEIDDALQTGIAQIDTTKLDQRVGEFATANNIELAYVPTNASWLNRIEPQFSGLRYFALDGTDHRSHAKQGQMIRRYISWRNRNACNPDLRRIVDRANVC